jgi:hypothetical protein
MGKRICTQNESCQNLQLDLDSIMKSNSIEFLVGCAGDVNIITPTNPEFAAILECESRR